MVARDELVGAGDSQRAHGDLRDAGDVVGHGIAPHQEGTIELNALAAGGDHVPQRGAGHRLGRAVELGSTDAARRVVSGVGVPLGAHRRQHDPDGVRLTGRTRRDRGRRAGGLGAHKGDELAHQVFRQTVDGLPVMVAVSEVFGGGLVSRRLHERGRRVGLCGRTGRLRGLSRPARLQRTESLAEQLSTQFLGEVLGKTVDGLPVVVPRAYGPVLATHLCGLGKILVRWWRRRRDHDPHLRSGGDR